MKIYISGQITGLDPEIAEKKFEFAEKHLIGEGHDPINPFKIEPWATEPKWEDYMVADIRKLFQCEAVYMLKNWHQSKGARIEHAIAKECEMKIFYQ